MNSPKLTPLGAGARNKILRGLNRKEHSEFSGRFESFGKNSASGIHGRVSHRIQSDMDHSAAGQRPGEPLGQFPSWKGSGVGGLALGSWAAVDFCWLYQAALGQGERGTALKRIRFQSMPDRCGRWCRNTAERRLNVGVTSADLQWRI